MKKKDIRIERLLAWDEYKGKTFASALPAIYAHASQVSQNKCDWYWKSVKSKRLTSLGIRLLTFLLLIVGTLLPILAGLGADADHRLLCTQLGVVTLALAGLLQLADRVFGWSSGWLRYITTVTGMENFTRQYELDWASYIIGKGSNLADGDIKSLFDLAKRFEDNLAKLQSDETDRWVTEFTSSVAMLNDLIKSQREAGERSIQSAQASQKEAAAQDAANQDGSVEVSLTHKAAPVPVTIGLDQDSPQAFVGTMWAKLGVRPGPHTVTVQTGGSTPCVVQKVVVVSPGQVSRIEVSAS